MRRVLILVSTLTLFVAGLAVAANAAPPGQIVGHWQAQDFGGGDDSKGTLLIAPSGRYRVFDDAGSICFNNGQGFVPVSISGRGTISADGFTLTTSGDDVVYCYTPGGRVSIGTIAPLVFVFDTGTGRIEDSGNIPTDTCYWRTRTPQPAECPPGP